MTGSRTSVHLCQLFRGMVSYFGELESGHLSPWIMRAQKTDLGIFRVPSLGLLLEKLLTAELSRKVR